MTGLTILPITELHSDQWFDQRRGMVTASVVGKLITTGYPTAESYSCPDCGAEAKSPCRSKVKRDGVFGSIKTVHQSRTDIAASSRDDQHRVIKAADNDESRGLTALLAAERITGHTEPTFTSTDMWRGIEDEPRARDAYSAHHGARVTECGFMIRDHAWGFRIGYSTDGLVGDVGLIEIKSRAPKKQLQTVLADEVPLENLAQCQAGLLVSGREWLDYVSYCGGMPLYVKRVYPSEQWFYAITAAVQWFEENAAAMIGSYTAATKGLPLTERHVEPEMTL
jgi:hypothetical protein